ncbi:MAG: phage major capsid protein [Leuconostoc pseudomesenteroides]|uniref:phage major capsid protein n=1 Tax=Leuconostoc pseudomesenteroides TaxID=33968 RepID=UPI0039E8F0F0
MDLNTLNNAWIEAGHKVEDLQAKQSEMAVALVADPNKYTDEEVSKVKDDLTAATKSRDFAKAAFTDAQANAEVTKPVAVNASAEPKKLTNEQLKAKFVNEFKGMIKGNPAVVNQIDSSTDANGDAIGLTIPQDIQTAIHTLVRQYNALQQYVNVESVSTLSGSRVYEKWSDVTPLANLDADDATIGDNDDPKLTIIKYLIKRYAGISTVTNTLLKDTAENILAWLSSWIAKKVVVTRNQAIIAAMNAAPSKPTVAKFDDVKDMVSTAVDPAIATTSFFMTNVSGLAVLNKVKDAMGNYLLQPNPTQPDVKQVDGKNIIVVADRWLPSAGTASAPVYPLYFGDLKQAVTLFDREQMSLLSTNIGAGAFEKDLTKIRVIDRFDVEATDTEAFVAGSFTAIADQTANFAAAASGK